MARATGRGLTGIVVSSVEVRSQSLVAWTYEPEGGEMKALIVARNLAILVGFFWTLRLFVP